MRKSVRLTDKAYERLLEYKREDESYSEEVMRLTEKEVKRSLSSFAGCWKGDKEELDRIFKEVDKERHEAKSSDFEI